MSQESENGLAGDMIQKICMQHAAMKECLRRLIVAADDLEIDSDNDLAWVELRKASQAADRVITEIQGGYGAHDS